MLTIVILSRINNLSNLIPKEALNFVFMYLNTVIFKFV